VVNRVRVAIDQGEVRFYERGKHPNELQKISRDPSHSVSKPPAPEIERFVAGKTYWLGFKAAETPGYVWIADPWDGDYLGGVTPKELPRPAYLLQAKKLMELHNPGTRRARLPQLSVGAEKDIVVDRSRERADGQRCGKRPRAQVRVGVGRDRSR